MKIAIPTANNEVDSHFGHCEYFTVFTIENNKVTNKQRVDSPVGCGCKSNIAATLMQMGVSIMLAGNMGQGAVDVLAAHHIKVVRGCTGNIDTLVDCYLNGAVLDSGITCAEHGKGHICSH